MGMKKNRSISSTL